MYIANNLQNGEIVETENLRNAKDIILHWLKEGACVEINGRYYSYKRIYKKYTRMELLNLFSGDIANNFVISLTTNYPDTMIAEARGYVRAALIYNHTEMAIVKSVVDYLYRR